MGELSGGKSSAGELSMGESSGHVINFLFCTVLPPGASKVDWTQKFDDVLNLTQFFHI